jgi:hypothetical protein
MLPKADPLQRKLCPQSAPLRLSVPRMCLRPCTMLPSRRPTLWIAELQSLKALVYPVSSFPCMLPMASVSPLPCYSCKLTHFYFIYLAFSFGTTLINEGHADAGQIINVIMAVLIGSFSLALMAPELQGMSRVVFFLYITMTDCGCLNL